MRQSLYEALEGMRAVGHTPEDRLVVRLSDGRLRFYPLESAERLESLRNEHGPVEAYAVASGEVRQLRPESRNSAIFAASLGMTTGGLPELETSRSPEGVAS